MVLYYQKGYAHYLRSVVDPKKYYTIQAGLVTPSQLVSKLSVLKQPSLKVLIWASQLFHSYLFVSNQPDCLEGEDERKTSSGQPNFAQTSLQKFIIHYRRLSLAHRRHRFVCVGEWLQQQTPSISRLKFDPRRETLPSTPVTSAATGVQVGDKVDQAVVGLPSRTSHSRPDRQCLVGSCHTSGVTQRGLQ